jgi:hypothetical protein
MILWVDKTPWFTEWPLFCNLCYCYYYFWSYEINTHEGRMDHNVVTFIPNVTEIDPLVEKTSDRTFASKREHTPTHTHTHEYNVQSEPHLVYEDTRFESLSLHRWTFFVVLLSQSRWTQNRCYDRLLTNSCYRVQYWGVQVNSYTTLRCKRHTTATLHAREKNIVNHWIGV